MAPVIVPTDKLREFVDFDAFYAWLAENHDSADEIWIRIFKKATGKPTISPVDAIQAVLCWGWIDAIKKSWDEESFVQRYCPRRPKSVWSQVNRDNVARLVEQGLMTEHGLVHVETAKADGRWDAAYKTTQEAPPDLLAAIAASPAAQAKYGQLTAQNRFALTFRTLSLKTEAARKKRIAEFVAMLERGETIYPQRDKP
ncbi:YdeI/OmpD-associated family protein [Devosia sp. XJ19-1]|uniref:YdeI/OmpD-associated family protein n=1 Tax=Devosia ureilytica TaxID=2952754 RepID=A0A9Q4ALV5_9HYPH|nr:YdeI/OmpD-associated family protein [Devosia ureilytica]MCP8883134.1 YdeI/OmpD-associated family protein [Devosia ureilytica]MCP8886498.1 YdeI/OmpD-associated family protein [Devosia ureilytica]